ncbi:hypothetical protein MTR67_043693 [Solanum verrucosum]|uniref:Uncharacterized protein n=1 Tax=Solanum verrucosum TaxID=315347 RepID=A0AAF0UPH8_SOLVR|nr:hypothetical protein MTR67_043675 [Solanum verrucosum]WMV50308.1 hypothetical protein MTR67_043693 [Solanum verrucosum]
MVKEGIIVINNVCEKGFEVDSGKIEVIENIPNQFLGKKIKFTFDEASTKAFECLKEKLISASFIIAPNWFEQFNEMCDVSCVALGVVLCHKCTTSFTQYTTEVRH